MAVSKLITYNPTEVFEFRWVTESFQMLGDIVCSPVFNPIPNCDEKWRIKLKFCRDSGFCISELQVFLFKEHSCIEKCSVKINLTFQCGGKFSFGNSGSKSLPVSIEKEKSYLLCSNPLRELIRNVYDSKDLDVTVKLNVSGYRVTYSSNPRPVIDFDDNLQDLSRDLERLYGDTITADLTFLVEKQKLFAHSAIIRYRSDVLAKMFDQDMLEGRTRRVRITDASFQVFDCFLRYLYTAKVKNESWDTMFDMYSLADRYAVSVLKTTCSRWLGMNLKVETVSNCLALAALHEDMELKQASMQFMRGHLRDVLDTSDWKHLVSNQPQLASEILSFATSRVGK